MPWILLLLPFLILGCAQTKEPAQAPPGIVPPPVVSQLTWTYPAVPGGRFVVERRLAGGEWVEIGSVPCPCGPEVSYVDSTLVPTDTAQTVHYRVTAVSDMGIASLPTARVTTTIPAAAPPPAENAPCRVTNVTGAMVTIGCPRQPPGGQ